MRKLYMGLAGLAAMTAATSALTGTAEAHSRGQVCYFQSIDQNGVVRNKSNYCHHIPSRYQQKPRSGFSLYFDFGNGWYYDRNSRYRGGRGQEQVCLVTFFERSQVAGGADVNVERARVLPRREAERRDGPNDRNRIFDYGTNRQTRDTCRYLNNINN